MKEQEGHYHARTDYCVTNIKQLKTLWEDINYVRKVKGKSLNVHLPFEIQHPDIYPRLEIGILFVRISQGLNRYANIPLYWENSPELNPNVWDLKHGQTVWTYVPRDIHLTLDTGHLILGSKNRDEAREKIRERVTLCGTQIRHLHIHENNLKNDEHKPIGHIITSELFEEITAGRTYIFEKGE